ncbi:transposase [Hungatella effluvii]|uniref:Transposase n=1 Tax=Hungatella effluvii TaxID=1096246 RepID=A0A2V3Y5N9_9FIRM|nr:IS66 family insertion sequence element accessory protein TnpB [Hungatella effluvii]PXX53687.1 transposase [Hungatella effluvii]
MLADISSVSAVYIVCSRTDMRKSIDGLCPIIQKQFSKDIGHALFLFCCRRRDRIKAILKKPDGIVLIYKRRTAQGCYHWPRDKSEVRNLTWKEFDWMRFGIDIASKRQSVYHENCLPR